MNLSSSQSSLSSAHNTPFAQQSPPPRRKPSHGSNRLNLSSSSSALNKPPINYQQPRSRIPLQWRAGASLIQPDSSHHPPSTLLHDPQHLQSLTHSTTTAKFNNIFNSTNISSATTTKEEPTRKLSSITSILRSHSISSDHSSASSASSSFSSSSSSPSVVSPSSQVEFDRNDLHPSPSGSIGINPIPSNSDPGILETQSSSLASTHATQFSSSSSIHHSISQSTSDSEPEDYEQEILSPQSQLFPTRSINTPTPSPGPQSNSTPTSNSSHHLVSASHSFICDHSQHYHSSAHCPSSSSHVSHPSPPSVTDLPFACPSPIVPLRLKNRPTRPVPTRAPPLPRSQTPSLLIRPKFSPCSHLDLAIQPIPPHSNSNVHSYVSIDPRADLKERPVSGSKTDMIRDLGWGPSPINSPYLVSSPHLACPSTSSIDLTTSELLAPHRSLGFAQIGSTDISSSGHIGSSSPPSQVSILRTKTKKFRDRFTLTSTAPLKITKRQKTHHTDNLASTSEAGRRIVSGLLNALSPTSASHVISDPANERRKAEFKKKISYPVLNHASGEDTLSHCGNEEHHDDDTDCYNLTIEAAVRSLEGIRSNGSSPRIARQVASNISLSDRLQDVPTPSRQFDKKLDSSIVQVQSNGIILDEMAQVWKRKLRKRISGKRLLAKSNRNQVEDDEIELDGPSAGSSQLVRGTHRQVRNKAGARLKPLLHRVSSLSLRQRAYFSEAETRSIFEPSKSGQKGCIIVDECGEEEELARLDEHFDTRSNSGLHSELKPDSRFRWIRSSISKKKNARSVPSSAIDMATPKRQQGRPMIKSSQSIREKRKIFEPEATHQFNDSLPDLPTVSASLLSASFTPADQLALRDARLSTDPLINKRSSMLSQRQPPSRKPTPAEIKLKDETRSVKALVNKFEHQSYKSLPRSVGSDHRADRASQRGRASSTGFVRNSLASIWSGSGSSISKNLSSTRSSKQLAREQRRKRRGWSSANTFSDASECAHEAETIPIQKTKKKKKQKTWSKGIFQNDDSSFSSFGCDLQERDEEDYETGPISDHTELSDASYHLATMLSTSSVHRSRWTCSNRSSREVSEKDSEANPADFKHQSSQSSSNDVNVEFDSLGSFSRGHQVGADYELQASSDNQLSEPENSNENRTWSLLSSEQAQTVLEPQTVWMGDGSERKILVAGGRLQMAKKIPFPSFEDDAEFSQPVNLQQNPSITEEPLSSKPIRKAVEKNKQSNRISSFLRTRKFDNHELDEDEDDGTSDRTDDRCIQIGSKLAEEDLGSRMMCAANIVSLQDSPTHGRGRRSLQRSMLMDTSERSNLGSPGRLPHLLLHPISDIGEKDQHQNRFSCNGSPNSIEMKQMCLSVDRCQGLGSKMFGSSISIQQRPCAALSGRCSGRRSASTVVSCALFRLSPTTRPRSHPPMSTSAVNAILNSFDKFDSAQLSPSRSLLISTSSRSSILGCDVLDRTQNENSTAITDLMDSREGVSAPKEFKISDRHVSYVKLDLKAPKSVTNLKFDGLENFDLGTIDANEVLKFELARLERVQGKWRKFCLEVEDVLEKSRERWPDQVEPDKVLGEFRRPTTKSTFEAFLASSQQLHKNGSLQAIQDVTSQFTPPSKHPFNSRPITPSTIAGYPSLNGNGRPAQRSPHVVTLPVPSAFVSPERFLGGDRIARIESERGPRVLKISNRSRQLGLRQQTLSNRLGGTGFKHATDRHRQARMISVTSSTGSFTSGGKVVLAERSVNQSPVTVRDPIQHLDENSKASSSPKIGSDQNVKLIGSLGRMNRPSIGKWARENEGSQWTSASMRETRKPWRRSILNPTTGFHGPPAGLRKSSLASNASSEEVGVLVADGDQPHEFADGFHTSGSLRLKYRRRLNQAKSDRSIGKGAQEIHLKSSKTKLGVPHTSICKKAHVQAVNKQSSENKSSISNHLELNKKKSQITVASITNHRI